MTFLRSLVFYVFYFNPFLLPEFRGSQKNERKFLSQGSVRTPKRELNFQVVNFWISLVEEDQTLCSWHSKLERLLKIQFYNLLYKSTI